MNKADWPVPTLYMQVEDAKGMRELGNARDDILVEIQRLEDAGDVRGWMRQTRRLLFYGFKPQKIVVSTAFREKLDEHARLTNENLGAEVSVQDTRGLTFRGVPIVTEEPACEPSR